MGAPNVFPLAAESVPMTRSLFGRPTRRAYRAAVAQIIRDVKARHKLSNEALADEIGCHEDTVRNAENENGNLDPVTLLSIAYAFDEEAIDPVRMLTAKPDARPESAEARAEYLAAYARPRACRFHMPFAGHRTVAEVWADEQRLSMSRGSGRR
jgi:DNA-binding XRE family transcriptional regulator